MLLIFYVYIAALSWIMKIEFSCFFFPYNLQTKSADYVRITFLLIQNAYKQTEFKAQNWSIKITLGLSTIFKLQKYESSSVLKIELYFCSHLRKTFIRKLHVGKGKICILRQWNFKACKVLLAKKIWRTKLKFIAFLPIFNLEHICGPTA